MEVVMEISFDLRGQHVKTSRKTLEVAKSSVKFKSILAIYCNKNVSEGVDEFNKKFAPVIRAIVNKSKCGVHAKPEYCPETSLTFFIDRDPEYFKAVLSYLSTHGTNQISKDINPDGLIEEAIFFDIPDLVDNLRGNAPKLKQPDPASSSKSNKNAEDFEKLLELLIESRDTTLEEIELQKKLLERKDDEVSQLKTLIDQKGEEIQQLKELLEQKKELMKYMLEKIG